MFKTLVATIVAATVVATTPASANPVRTVAKVIAKECAKRPRCQRSATETSKWLRRRAEAAADFLGDQAKAAKDSIEAYDASLKQQRRNRAKAKRADILNGLALPARQEK